MTGGGRCQKRRKSMAGGRGTAEPTKIDSGNYTKALGFPKITKLPPTSRVELDLYTQARKALSLRSPFDSEDSEAPPASVSSANSLPSGVSHLLSRHSDSRKRHKKLHSGSEKKSSTTGRPRGTNIWVETEEYFRELTIEDIERLDSVSSNLQCEKDSLNLENSVELSSNGKPEFNEVTVQEENGPRSMDVDEDEVETTEFQIIEESNGEKRLNSENHLTSFSGVEWLLGSRSKIYLASERPSKKRKLLGRDAGLEKLLVARPVEALDSVCHYCSYGDMGDPVNLLVKCSSCGMVVHQRCYGVQEDADSSWLCSWCKLKDVVDLNTVTPCLLCPKQGGALKPVQKRGFVNDNKGSKVEFAHLFCCQWMPEVYLENTRTMEPIMNLDELKDTRRKLICYLCKVKRGACVRCSNGSCRTSFHPICAREARHRLEIWGKLGSDEVELRAFCSKHSEVQCDSGSQDTGDIPFTGDSVSHFSENQQLELTVNESHKSESGQRNGDKLVVHNEIADLDLSKPNDIVLDGEDLLDNRRDSESHLENGDALHSAAKYSANRNGNEDVNVLNFSMILKKLIDLGKVSAKDVASEIGVLPDSLDTILTDNHMVPELQCKLLRWLKKHAHIGNLQKTLTVRIRSLLAPEDLPDVADAAEGVGAVPVEESNVSDSVPVKSVPPRRRTKSSIRTVKDGKSCSSKDKNDDEKTDDDVDSYVLVAEDSNGPSREPDNMKKILIDSEQHQDDSANDFIKIEDELRVLAQFLSEDGQVGETRQSQQMTMSSLVLMNGEVNHASYIHPYIYSKLMQTKKDALEKTTTCRSAVLRDREASQLEASSSSGLCCSNDNMQQISGDRTSRCSGLNLDQLVKARNMGILKLSPADEVEGELLYNQQRLLCNAVARKYISDDLISKVVRSLPQEIDAAGKRKWDAVLVSQYIHDLREAKKQGRKERRHKEAQAVLAAATAAAAASSRTSSMRKDTLEETSQHEDFLKTNASDVRSGVYTQLNPRVKETISRLAVARSSFDTSSDSVLAADFSKDHPRTCDVCRRSETVLNPILVCSSCKVAVHLDCYRGVKSTTGPWHCELCEDLVSSRGSGALATNSWEKPYFVAECGLCGGTAGAFRKSVDGQWIHALCAEWVLESTYKRGQVNPIERMVSAFVTAVPPPPPLPLVVVVVDPLTGHGIFNKHTPLISSRIVSARELMLALYAVANMVFALRSAGFYMTVRTTGGKLQHKAYCEKHSTEQRAKADTQKHGIEEFKSLKQVRVELERLRLLCERIIKREKLKFSAATVIVFCKELHVSKLTSLLLPSIASAIMLFYFALCSVNWLFARIIFLLQIEILFCLLWLVTLFTNLKLVLNQLQRLLKATQIATNQAAQWCKEQTSVTVDSTVAGKRRSVKVPMSLDNDRKTDDSSTSQNLYTLKPTERVSFSGKQIPQRVSAASRNLSDDVETRSKYRKVSDTHTETFEKELIMTSDQATMKNQRLPKGFVYVPIRCLSKDKENVQDPCPRESVERNG
ncbi:hypothetical protein DH2020_007063 [Rehmannia glutinosa]|uniref:Uncharacterized protein n=1 Tax=Rehmannia glutinosa TaxID=99300 RepID=A0ABR0TXE8_REHGL